MIESKEYERVKQDKHNVILDSVGYGNVMVYAADLVDLIESLRTVTRAAKGFSYVGPACNYLGEPLDDYVTIRLEKIRELDEALDALPQWVLEETE